MSWKNNNTASLINAAALVEFIIGIVVCVGAPGFSPFFSPGMDLLFI